MADQHRETKATVRPPADLKARAQDALAGTDWTFNDFMVACLALLVKRPKTFLKQLEPFKPERRRGRPRKV